MNLVIGATGQSGSAAASALAARQGTVRVLLRPSADDAPYVRAGCEIMRGDLTRPETLAPALENVTGIVNFVGIGHDLKTPRATVETVEIVGNRNFNAAAQAAGGASHVVYLSVLMAERAPCPFAREAGADVWCTPAVRGVRRTPGPVERYASTSRTTVSARTPSCAIASAAAWDCITA